MEMNTRLQVEHPVTEVVTGLDLVEWQLRVAAGEKLTVGPGRHRADRARDRGAGLRRGPGARLSADRRHGARRWSNPTVRRAGRFGLPPGTVVGSDYDPMLAKVIAHGADRASALRAARSGPVRRPRCWAWAPTSSSCDSCSPTTTSGPAGWTPGCSIAASATSPRPGRRRRIARRRGVSLVAALARPARICGRSRPGWRVGARGAGRGCGCGPASAPNTSTSAAIRLPRRSRVEDGRTSACCGANSTVRRIDSSRWTGCARVYRRRAGRHAVARRRAAAPWRSQEAVKRRCDREAEHSGDAEIVSPMPGSVVAVGADDGATVAARACGGHCRGHEDGARAVRTGRRHRRTTCRRRRSGQGGPAAGPDHR